MHRLRMVVQQAASPTLGSRAASIGLVGSVIGLPPLLYLCFNSAACLIFAVTPSETCGTRIEANFALAMTLIFSDLLPVLLVFEPISLVNATTKERTETVAVHTGMEMAGLA